MVRAVNALHEDIRIHGILAARPAKESYPSTYSLSSAASSCPRACSVHVTSSGSAGPARSDPVQVRDRFRTENQQVRATLLHCVGQTLLYQYHDGYGIY
jgi:hypothetical protein